MDWQPISTAPKDGTRILVYGDGQFRRGGTPATPEDIERDVWVAHWDDDAMPVGFWNCSSDGWVIFVTHWMPLPAPPHD